MNVEGERHQLPSFQQQVINCWLGYTNSERKVWAETTISATEAKADFGCLTSIVRVEPLLTGKHRHPFPMVMSVEEF